MQDEENINQVDPNVNLDEMEDDDTIVLTDEDGNEVKFEYVGSVRYEEENYVILIPTEEVENEEEGDSEVVILREDTNSEEEAYLSVDDEEVLNKVFEMFKEKYSDDFNFIEEE